MNPSDYLEHAARHCQTRGARLTDLRRQVLELALRATGLVKAYQVLSLMQSERGVVAPPTVYRALDFLVEQGLLHRVEALNGYVVCPHFDCPHDSLILVCEACGGVNELDTQETFAPVWAACAAQGFTPRRQDVVLTGRCQACAA